MFSEQRSSQSCWQETGAVGRGRLVTIPPRPISHQPVGVGQPGEPGRDDLGEMGESETCHLIVPCSHALILGVLLRSPWHARASVQVQMLRRERRHDLSKVAQ